MNGRTLSDYLFHGSPDERNSNSNHARQPMTDAEATAVELRETRDRFAKGTERDNESEICRPPERAAVLAVYHEALQKINAKNHREISSEVTLKVAIILGITTAEPYDMAFTNNMSLRHLEPKYANPRIETKDDQYERRAQARITAWRNDGWPAKYPSQAIAEERRRGKSLVKGGQTDLQLRTNMLKAPAEKWGNQVNATPDRLVERKRAQSIEDVDAPPHHLIPGAMRILGPYIDAPTVVAVLMSDLSSDPAVAERQIIALRSIMDGAPKVTDERLSPSNHYEVTDVHDAVRFDMSSRSDSAEYERREAHKKLSLDDDAVDSDTADDTVALNRGDIEFLHSLRRLFEETRKSKNGQRAMNV